MPGPTRKDLQFMRWAVTGAEIFSTCGKGQYMAIVTDVHGHVLGSGYNGGPRGFMHCVDGGCPRFQNDSPSGSSYDDCLGGETEIITAGGTAAIGDMIGTSPLLLTTEGWLQGEIRSFGVQPLWKVTFKRDRRLKEVWATAGHRWFTHAAHGPTILEVRTPGLRSAGPERRNGERMVSVYAPSVTETSHVGIQAGFVHGDGTRDRRQPNSGSFVTLFGEKVEVEQYFGGRHKPRDDGSVHVTGLPWAWKDLPSLDESDEFLLGWLMGYFAADGAVGRGGHATISCAKVEPLLFARDVCYRLGIPVGEDIRSIERVGIGCELGTLYSLAFPTRALGPDFLLRRLHRETMAAAPLRAFRPQSLWSVVGLEEADRVEEVYCAVVPGPQNFALSGNLLTGNCIAIHAESNAILHSDYSQRQGGTLYVNGLPCFTCAKLIVNSGLARVAYLAGRTAVDEPVVRDFFEVAGIELVECAV